MSSNLINRHSRGGSDTVTIAVLGVIIAGAVGLVIWMAMGGGEGGGDGPKTLEYQCEQCKHEFTVPTAELPDGGPDAEFPPRLDCPSCAKKACCFYMVQCPNPECEKFYLLQTQAAERAMRAGRNVNPEAVRDVCPHCQTDLAKWRQDHPKK